MITSTAEQRALRIASYDPEKSNVKDSQNHLNNVSSGIIIQGNTPRDSVLSDGFSVSVEETFSGFGSR
jgi:hypothetical protein